MDGFTKQELVLLNNALNEILHGTPNSGIRVSN
jgi:hypothetical protein